MDHTLRTRLIQAATKLASLGAAVVVTVALLGSQIGLAHHYRVQQQTEVAERHAQRLAAVSPDELCR